jgi:putative ubiquitin-RnfH superfamily antitoxin RatB of RatAB toxin-antitoxin module
MDRAEDGARAPSPGDVVVAVACSPEPGRAVEVEVCVAAGATVLDVVRRSGLLERFAQIDLSRQAVGVWGRACPLDTPVHAGDRVEIYRPLEMDPKEARRLRASRRPSRPR